MNNVTERVIARFDSVICMGASVESIVDLHTHEGITGYDAFLAYKAAEVSLRMRDRMYVEAK